MLWNWMGLHYTRNQILTPESGPRELINAPRTGGRAYGSACNPSSPDAGRGHRDGPVASTDHARWRGHRHGGGDHRRAADPERPLHRVHDRGTDLSRRHRAGPRRAHERVLPHHRWQCDGVVVRRLSADHRLDYSTADHSANRDGNGHGHGEPQPAERTRDELRGAEGDAGG